MLGSEHSHPDRQRSLVEASSRRWIALSAKHQPHVAWFHLSYCRRDHGSDNFAPTSSLRVLSLYAMRTSAMGGFASPDAVRVRPGTTWGAAVIGRGVPEIRAADAWFLLP